MAGTRRKRSLRRRHSSRRNNGDCDTTNAIATAEPDDAIKMP